MHNEKDREIENVQFESAIPMLLNMSKIGLNQLTTELFHWLHSLHLQSPLSLLVQMKDKMKPNLDQLSLQLRNRNSIIVSSSSCQCNQQNHYQYTAISISV